MPYRSLHDSADFGTVFLETEREHAEEHCSLPVDTDHPATLESKHLPPVKASSLSFTHVPGRFSTSLFSSEGEVGSNGMGSPPSQPPLNRAPSRFSTSLFAENFENDPAPAVSQDECYYGYDEDIPPTASAPQGPELETEDTCEESSKVENTVTIPPVNTKGAVVRRRNNNGLSSSLHGGSNHSFRRSRAKGGLRSSVTRPSACLSSFVSVIEEFQSSKIGSQNEGEALPDDDHEETSSRRSSHHSHLEPPAAPVPYGSPPKCSHSKHYKSDEEPSSSKSPTKSSTSQGTGSIDADAEPEHSSNTRHKKRHATSQRHLRGSMTSGITAPTRSPPKRSSSMGSTNATLDRSSVAQADALAGAIGATTEMPVSRSRSIGNGESMRHSDHGGDSGKRPSCPGPPCGSTSPKGSNELDRATYHCSRTTSSSNRRLRESSKGGNRSGSRSRKASSSSLRGSGTSDSSSDKPSRPSTFESPPSSRKSRRSSNKKTASYALELSNPVIWRSLNEIVRLDAGDWKPVKSHDHHSGRDFRYCELNIVLQT
jgi:hypothetical protein